MQRHLLTAALFAGLGFGALAWAAPATESTDADKITKLVEQLGSDSFESREKAQAALEKIGAPALEALRKAAASDEAELRRRAGELVQAIERNALLASILTPKKVHLLYKETPIAEAIADLKTKTGYEITLHDPENALKDRKVTLDTGETTFWDALDQFCRKAGVREPKQEDVWKRPIGVPVPPPIKGVPVPPPPVKGVVPVPLPPATDAPPPAPPIRKPVPVKEPPATDPPPAGLAFAPAAVAAPLPVAAPAVPPPPAPPVAVGVRIGAIARPIGFGGWGNQAGLITLVDGRDDAVPTDASTSFRIRAISQPDVAGIPLPGDINLNLQVAAEPRLRLQYAQTVRITKAVDEHGQKLEQVTDAGAGGGPGVILPGGGGFVRPHLRIAMPFGMYPIVPVAFKKGDKESKKLETLAGIISANVLLDATAMMTVDNILKASGKTVKGDEGGSIKVTEVKEDKEEITITIALDTPKDVIPENNPFQGGVPNLPPGGGIRPPILPRVPVPVPLPAPPPVPAAPPVPPAAKGAPAPAGAGVAVAGVGVAVPAIAAAPAIIVGRGGFGYTGPFNGLTLVDAKGKILPVQIQMRSNGVPGATMEYVFVYRPEKDSPPPAKLLFTARKTATVEIPFTLKGVKIGG
jgi:hypothetical protein